LSNISSSISLSAYSTSMRTFTPDFSSQQSQMEAVEQRPSAKINGVDEPIDPRLTASPTTTTIEADEPIVPRLVSDNVVVVVDSDGENQNRNNTSNNTFRAMQVYGLTYGTARYEWTLKRLKQEADESKLFKSFEINRGKDLDASFVDRFRDILNMPRGGGYWIWKVHLIQRHLKRLEYGDILVYLDGGCKVNKKGTDRFWWYVEQMHRTNTSIIAFDLGHAEEVYTTDAIFKYFNITPETALWKQVAQTGQFVGGLLVMRKTPQLESILAMYNQTLYDDPYLFTDYYNTATKAKRGNFNENRHDQSVFSVIRKLFPNDTLVISPDETYLPEIEVPFEAARVK
jgi:hypothetical protein